MRYLKARPDADPRGVGLFGISKGGSAGLLAAKRDPYIRCFVTDGIFATHTTMVPYMRKWYGIYNDQYAIQAFWSAVAYDVPVTFLVLRNEEYAILKWFASIEDVEGAPGLDLPRLDVAGVATGYGVNARRVGDGELREALAEGIASDSPELVEVRVAPGMALA